MEKRNISRGENNILLIRKILFSSLPATVQYSLYVIYHFWSVLTELKKICQRSYKQPMVNDLLLLKHGEHTTSQTFTSSMYHYNVVL